MAVVSQAPPLCASLPQHMEIFFNKSPQGVTSPTRIKFLPECSWCACLWQTSPASVAYKGLIAPNTCSSLPGSLEHPLTTSHRVAAPSSEPGPQDPSQAPGQVQAGTMGPGQPPIVWLCLPGESFVTRTVILESRPQVPPLHDPQGPHS